MTFNIETFQTIINDNPLLDDYIDVPYITTSETFDNEPELVEYLQERINECEVVYYSAAIKYLSENDPSLYESLSLAEEYGFTLDKLNSETLATILLQSNLSQELASCDFSECFADSEA